MHAVGRLRVTLLIPAAPGGSDWSGLECFHSTGEVTYDPGSGCVDRVAQAMPSLSPRPGQVWRTRRHNSHERRGALYSCDAIGGGALPVTPSGRTSPG